jgi:hypothetical protein
VASASVRPEGLAGVGTTSGLVVLDTYIDRYTPEGPGTLRSVTSDPSPGGEVVERSAGDLVVGVELEGSSQLVGGPPVVALQGQHQTE